MHPETTTLVPHGSRPGHDALLERPVGELVPLDALSDRSYYDIPLLKKPVWTPEIGWYFFLGGLSAGSYLLARVAERLGGQRYRAVTRAGTWIALGALAPCPVLLIVDLGDPKRFHHMLRVFKWRSPMSLGSWVLTGYSGVVFFTARGEWFRGRRRGRPNLRGKAALLTLDAAGLPLAILFSGYTGVLLSGTATPVWSQNPWIGPLFSASALSNGASAINLALELRRGADEETAKSPEQEALEKIDTAAHAAEAVTTAGYLSTAGSLAKPLPHGKLAPYF
jgi:formate-dependent nitrite reductase membrane component NrfD